LAFDTSTASCSVAVCQDDRLLAERYEEMPRGQSEALVPMIDAVLKEAELKPENIDLLAVSTGPGAFTGVRIGLATARALALALNCPLIGVSTFEALVHGLDDPIDDPINEPMGRQILCIIDTKRGDVFAQQFDSDLATVGDASVMSYEDVQGRIKKIRNEDGRAEGRTVLVGDGISGFLSICDKALIDTLDVYELAPRAEIIAEIAALRGIPDTDILLPKSPEAIYLRPPEAKISPNGGRLR